MGGAAAGRPFCFWCYSSLKENGLAAFMIEDLEAAIPRLPEKGRARPARALPFSVGEVAEVGVEHAWIEEAQHRYEEIRQGDVEAQGSYESCLLIYSIQAEPLSCFSIRIQSSVYPPRGRVSSLYRNDVCHCRAEAFSWHA